MWHPLENIDQVGIGSIVIESPDPDTEPVTEYTVEKKLDNTITLKSSSDFIIIVWEKDLPGNYWCKNSIASGKTY
jgi:hypothetical protein